MAGVSVVNVDKVVWTHNCPMRLTALECRCPAGEIDYLEQSRSHLMPILSGQ